MHIQYQDCVRKKKEEFSSYLSPSHLSCHDQDSWLLSRMSPNSGCKEDTNRQAATEHQAEIDNDSGLDSPKEDHADNDKVTPAGNDEHSDEMQEVRLNMRARNCRNITTARPKIPIRLCKVTKV
jgi:hypothetical protein